MKSYITCILFILLSSFPLVLISQDVPPPPPPNHGTEGNTPPGGGAPANNGVLILTLLAVSYGGYKYYMIHRKSLID